MALVVLAGAIVTLLVVITGAVAPDFLPGEPAGDAWVQTQLQSLAGLAGSGLAIAVLVALAMVGLILLEVRAPGRGEALLISATEQGGLTIEEESVRYLAEKTGLSNRQIASLRCRLMVRGRRSATPANIIIACYPRVVLGSNVQEVRDDLQARVKSTVEDLTGLKVLQVHVSRVRYDRSETSRLLGA